MTKTTKTILLSVFVLAGLATSGTYYHIRQNIRRDVASNDVLPRSKLVDDATSVLKVDNARIIFDNDIAFRTKLMAVQDARTEIRLAYYIYHDDYTSSLFTQALIKAAQRGVKVKVLLDYFYNYRHLDLFTMMEREGRGNLEIRFFNRPTANIIKDVVYMTTPCPKTGNCQAAKEAYIQQLFKNEGAITNLDSGPSGQFLSGFYSKDAKVMMMAISNGVDFAKLKQGAGGNVTPEQKEQLKKIAKIYWKSKTSKGFERLWNKIQLTFAFAFFGEQLQPLFQEATGLAPLEARPGSNANRDWAHLTDFLHHKLLLADTVNQQGLPVHVIQVGGRNIEDAYSMNPNDAVEKYVFWDTDLRAEITSGADQVKKSFDALWNFRSMVATISEVRQHAPNDLTANNDIVSERCKERFNPHGEATEVNLSEDPTENIAAANATADLKAKIAACVEQESSKTPLSLDERIALRKQETLERAKKYLEKFPNFVTGEPIFKDLPGTLKLPEEDKAEMLAVYMENLPYNRNLPENQRVRMYGADNARSKFYGKEYHINWIRSMWRACELSVQDGSPRVIYLHNAYFFPGSNILTAMREMYNGKRDCSKVTLKVITNSVESTDLSIVNLFARHSMRAFYEAYAANKDPGRAMKIEYYEYKGIPTGASVSAGKQVHISLHSKVAVIGNDVIVGSANADIRSYYMDTNDGIVLRYAPHLAANYRAYLDQLVSDTNRVVNMTDYFKKNTHADMLRENEAALRLFLQKRGWDKKLKEDQVTGLVNLLNTLFNKTYNRVVSTLKGDKAAADEFNGLFQGI